MSSSTLKAGCNDVDPPTPAAPDTDRTAWKQMMQARKERMTDRAREEAKPLHYNPSQNSNNRPRFSLSFRGPSIVSPQSTHYPLKATVHYHLDPSITDLTQQQPVAFSTRSTPLAQNEQLEFCCNLYSSPSLDFDSHLDFRRNRTLVRPDRTKPRDPKLPIAPEKGFVQIAPGEDLVFELSLKLDYWLRELESGKVYWLQFAGKEDVIKYWRYGSLQDLDQQKCDLDEDGGIGKGIALTHLNSVAFAVESKGVSV